MATYSLNDFDRIGINNYELPEYVIKSINSLCQIIGYNNNTSNTYINQYNATSTVTTTVKPKPREKEVREQTYKKPKENDNEWKRPQFKATVFAQVDTTQEIINSIRIELNKINESNCEDKIKSI